MLSMSMPVHNSLAPCSFEPIALGHVAPLTEVPGRFGERDTEFGLCGFWRIRCSAARRRFATYSAELIARFGGAYVHSVAMIACAVNIISRATPAASYSVTVVRVRIRGWARRTGCCFPLHSSGKECNDARRTVKVREGAAQLRQHLQAAESIFILQ